MQRRGGNGFMFEYFADESGALTRIFWADRVSKRDAEIFGDVVSFDATYRTNKYNLVFVPFTGIDNHGCSITLAVGLIAQEDADSYHWLLRCFKKLTHNDPLVMITDQDPSMKNAMSAVFPNTRHRLCMWHILQKLPGKVLTSTLNDEFFYKRLNAVIWLELCSTSEFEQAWSDVITDYGLEENPWLCKIFNLRSGWIPAYFRETEMGSLLRTTSRSESQNAFFVQFLNRRMTLVQFYVGFNSAIDKQHNNRLKFDHEARTSTPSLKTTHPLEKHASEIFSIKVFTDFQSELLDSAFDSGIENITKADKSSVYVIQDGKRNRATFQVTVAQPNDHLSCSCMRYHNTGYICRHLLCVMSFLQYTKVPNFLIRDRWRKEASGMHISQFGDFENEIKDRHKEEYFASSEIMREVRSFIGDPRVTLATLQGFLGHVKGFGVGVPTQVDGNSSSKDALFASVLGMGKPSECVINVPNQSRNKGCGKRIRSPFEIAMQKVKKAKNKCTNCQKIGGHNKRTCPGKSNTITTSASVHDSTPSTQESRVDQS